MALSLLAANGIHIHYRLEGPLKAPLLVFANSLGTDLRVWVGGGARRSGRFRKLR